MKLLLSLILLTAFNAQAADADKLGLHNESELGYIVVGGNAKSESFSGKSATTYQWASDNAKLTGSYLNTKAGTRDASGNLTTARTAENWDVKLRWEHIVVENKFDTYLEAGLMKDHFRGIDQGTSYGLGAKYHWINSDTLKLFSELGYQRLEEKLDDNTTLESDFIRVFSQIDYEYTKSMKVGFKAEYLHDLDEKKNANGQDETNYRFNFSPYLLAVLNDTFSLKFAYEGQYRSLPAAGNRERLDFKHTTALIAKF